MENETKKEVENINKSNEKLLLSDVSQRSEQLVCPNCKSVHICEKPFNYLCHHCGQKFRQTNCD